MQKWKIAFLPIALLATLSLIRWQMWKRDNPPVTAADLKVRRILEKASIIQFGMDGNRFSSQQKQTLVAHLWLTRTPIEAAYPAPAGKNMEIYFKVPKGQGRIDLRPDAAFSCLLISRWAQEPTMGGSPVITTSEEYYRLHPVTNRFLRAWLSANAP